MYLRNVTTDNESYIDLQEVDASNVSGNLYDHSNDDSNITPEEYFDLSKDYKWYEYEAVAGYYEMINYEPVNEDGVIYRIYYEYDEEGSGVKYINGIPETRLFSGFIYAG